MLWTNQNFSFVYGSTNKVKLTYCCYYQMVLLEINLIIDLLDQTTYNSQRECPSILIPTVIAFLNLIPEYIQLLLPNYHHLLQCIAWSKLEIFILHSWYSISIWAKRRKYVRCIWIYTDLLECGCIMCPCKWDVF